MNAAHPTCPTPAGEHPPRRVHQLFEAQVRRTPQACAATMAGSDALSYGELDQRANGLAQRLRARGVGPETIVGVCLERSVAGVTAILAVLKAGGAYLPLDPAYPAERLAFMLENSRARVLLAARGELDGRPWPAGLAVVPPEPDASTGETGTHQEEVTGEGSDPLAYVIYTSGSTGRPKGVAMPHGPLGNLLRWQARACPLPPGSRVLQFAPLSFDVSFQEMFSTLGEGGTLVLIPESLRRDPAGLLRLLDEQKINRVFLPPVMLAQLAERWAGGGALPCRLREVITAGEALRLTPAVVRFFSALRELDATCTLHNHYGPTETHVATALTLSGYPQTWPALPSIGRPIDGAQARVLHGETGLPVSPGEAGMLELGGECLARGYLHDPELTARKFIERDGQRWYRVGDLARQLPDGTLQFLGRADDQVKIRGFRVELGEVEEVLGRHPGVREAAVGVVGSDGDAAGAVQELVACFVPRDGSASPAVADLRLFLLGELPDYMVPARWAVVEALPLTPSGKVDRRAVGRLEITPVKAVDPARTPTEKSVLAVWREVLGRTPGIHENFFEAGGNSLLAMQVHTRLCQTLGREFSITDLFQRPTIATLAAHLDASAPQTLQPGSSVQDRARRAQQQQQHNNQAAAARARLAATANRPR